MRKRILCTILCVIVLLGAVSMSSCSKAPELDSVKDRFIYLIEESKQLNTVFFGSGLPIYVRESEIADRLGVYGLDSLDSYNNVIENSGYLDINSIKEAAERVYSTSYLEEIYETAFDGVITSGGLVYLRFYENEKWLYQSINATDFGLSERIYDYSTMKIVTPSSEDYVNITIDSYTLDDEKVKTVSLSFVFEDGEWYLDSPTY